MGDVHIPQPESSKVGAKVHDLIESGHEFYASTLTGTPSGRVRRPTLYLVAIIGLLADMAGFFPAGAIVAGIAIVLLALTDAVVEL